MEALHDCSQVANGNLFFASVFRKLRGKPENVLLDRKGRVKISDFGLAKLLDQAAADFTLTGQL